MARPITDFSYEPADRGAGSLWIWFVVLGAAMIVLGVLAFLNLPTATAASVYMMGIFMLIGAVAQVVHAFEIRHWAGFVILLLSSILFGVAGYLAFANPSLAAQAMTLVLALAWIASGIMRTWWSFLLRALPGWGWLTFSGIVTALAGAVFLGGWPANSAWLLGVALSVDLVFQGVSAISFGTALKGRAK